MVNNSYLKIFKCPYTKIIIIQFLSNQFGIVARFLFLFSNIIFKTKTYLAKIELETIFNSFLKYFYIHIQNNQKNKNLRIWLTVFKQHNLPTFDNALSHSYHHY
ncbi:hypothetical protein AAZX31_U032500 [Glycine max]